MANEKNNPKTPIAPVIPANVKISSMPEQFFPSKEKKKFPVLLVVILVLIFGGVVVGAVIMFGRSVNQNPLPIAVVNENTNQPDLNENVNLNANQNENVNLNVNENVNTNVPPPPPPTPTGPRELVSTQDTDQDKLTDIEEDTYTTDPKRPDTDGDGHLDGAEVQNLFDPLKPAPAMLETSGLVTKYPNDKWGYVIDYPTKWVARAIDIDQREVMFTSALGEFIEVLIQDNPDHLPVDQWYAKQSPGVNPTTLQTFVTKRGMKGVTSSDGLTVYLAPDAPDPSTAGTVIYTVSYNAGLATAYNYLTTWQMMINSFQVTNIINPPAPAPAPETTPTPPATPPATTPTPTPATPPGVTPTPPSDTGPGAPPPPPNQ